MSLHAEPTSGEAAPQPKAGLLPGSGKPRLRRLAPAAIATLIAFAILVGLGFWQVERMGAKQRLLARVEAGLAAPPKPLPPEQEWPALQPKAYEYAKVRFSGIYLHDREIHVHGLLTTESKGNAPPSTALGFYIVTPMRLADGAIVLVNRGFVPTGRENPATRQEGQLAGEQTVVGLMKGPQDQGWFVPDDDPARNHWFTRDPAKMAAALRLPRVSPFIVDADATPVPGGLPVGGRTIVSFPNNHLQYALTWFALALGLLAVFFAWARQQVKGKGEARPSPAPRT